MGRLQKKGKAGAAKAYITRTSAIRKLQCTLADFRRLCILKGIFPREPRNKKRANKGSTAPTSFYYAKEIAYLAHEPILKKFREHKAFAKKLSRALGRGDWVIAKSLETSKPVYRLDHIVKERYPTFIDALQDIDDALCMVFLFSSLPSQKGTSPSLLENCTRLSAEWQLYVLHTRSLRKVFLSIKGIYYQAEVMNQNINWLVPYQFTQNVTSDTDMRVLRTFLELYQTLLGFVFFKLYTDAGLTYPPPLDIKKDEAAAGLHAFRVQPNGANLPPPVSRKGAEANRPKVSSRSVRQTIKAITADSTDVDMAMTTEDINTGNPEEEQFVHHPSTTDPQESTPQLNIDPTSSVTLPPVHLFSPYTFFISRETSRTIFEFIIRAFDGRVGWPASSGAGSPFDETDPSITHVIIDRPLVKRPDETPEQRERRLARKYVQPQWVVDCINAGKILLEDLYAQGQSLPPHLSPFGELEDAYDPTVNLFGDVSRAENESTQAEEEIEEREEEVDSHQPNAAALNAVAKAAAQDPAALRTAELAAELAGVEYRSFAKQVRTHVKETKSTTSAANDEDLENDANKMMLSNKQRKLYERVRHSKQERMSQRKRLEQRRKDIETEKRKHGKLV